MAVWTIPWKGFALWKSARKGDKYWFVVLLLINTAAILEILYLFIFSEKKPQTQEPVPTENKTDGTTKIV